MTEYLKPTYFLDFEHPLVQDFTQKHTRGAETPREKAVRLYYAVRDGFIYNPYQLDLRREGLQASNLAARASGYCVEKSVLLAATCRAVGIPSRLSFFNVCNHIATERIEQVLGTNVLVFHGATELFLEGKWVKATPAFNAALCEKLNVETLEFTGLEDSIFQQFDRTGSAYMSYLHEYGAFEDMPYDTFLGELRKHYGTLVTEETLQSCGYVLNLLKFERKN